MLFQIHVTSSVFLVNRHRSKNRCIFFLGLQVKFDVQINYFTKCFGTELRESIGPGWRNDYYAQIGNYGLWNAFMQSWYFVADADPRVLGLEADGSWPVSVVACSAWVSRIGYNSEALIRGSPPPQGDHLRSYLYRCRPNILRLPIFHYSGL